MGEPFCHHLNFKVAQKNDYITLAEVLTSILQCWNGVKLVSISRAQLSANSEFGGSSLMTKSSTGKPLLPTYFTDMILLVLCAIVLLSKG